MECSSAEDSSQGQLLRIASLSLSSDDLDFPRLHAALLRNPGTYQDQQVVAKLLQTSKELPGSSGAVGCRPALHTAAAQEAAAG
jgi:hypothetical protein